MPLIKNSILRKASLFILLFSLTCFCTAKRFKISRKTDSLVNDLRQYKMIHETMGLGSDGTPSEQIPTLYELARTASSKELLHFINDTQPIIRCLAFLIYAETSKENDLLPIIEEKFHDDDSVASMAACFFTETTVSAYFIKTALPRLSDKERVALDSILIFSDSLPSSLKMHRRYAIERLEINEQNYDFIKKLAQSENPEDGVVLLAKYGREEDVPIIIEAHKKIGSNTMNPPMTYAAMRELPHASYLPILKEEIISIPIKGYQGRFWSARYAAVAANKNSEALEILTLPFTHFTDPQVKSEHLKCLYYGLIGENDPLYRELFWRLWEEGEIVSVIDLIQFKFIDEQRMLKNARKSLLNVEQCIRNVNSIDEYSYRSRSIKEKYESSKRDTSTIDSLYFSYDFNSLYAMLDLVDREDPKFVYEVVKKVIENNTYRELNAIIRSPIITSKKEFISLLLRRMNIEDNSHLKYEIYLQLLKLGNKFQCAEELHTKLMKVKGVNKVIMEYKERHK